MKFKTVYLTGAPATGKTTLMNSLEGKALNLAIWRYSCHLMKTVGDRLNEAIGHKQLREKSSALVEASDVTQTDELLLSFVEAHRNQTHILIDSHPVTKEDYGFRTTMFSKELLEPLEIDEIWVLYAAPTVLADRMNSDGGGRKSVTIQEMEQHTNLQNSVALAYGLASGCPVYHIDASAPLQTTTQLLAKRLNPV